MVGLILRITARRDGFRRAGRAWTVAPQDVPADTLSDDQLAALRAEPMLTVIEIPAEKTPAEIAPPAPPPPAADGEGGAAGAETLPPAKTDGTADPDPDPDPDKVTPEGSDTPPSERMAAGAKDQAPAAEAAQAAKPPPKRGKRKA